MFYTIECAGEHNEDPVFQNLLSVWGVDLKNWKQVQPNKISSPAPPSSEVSPSPSCSICTGTPRSLPAESPSAETPASAKEEPDASKDRVSMLLHVL